MTFLSWTSTGQKGGKAANTYTGRKADGQKGHKGKSLTKSYVQKKIKSGEFRHDIHTIGNPSHKKYIAKYALDLDMVSVIKELRIYMDKNGHFSFPPECRSDVTYGENIKSMAVALYNEGIMFNDRIAAFLNAISDDRMELSEGSIYGFCCKFAKSSRVSVEHLEIALLNRNVVATDTTVTTTNREENYIWNFSIPDTVVYHAMRSKSVKVLEEINFPGKYAGILVHGHETALYHFETDHAECNVHLIRYLRNNRKDTDNPWSGQRSICSVK